ncbi:hypothetical protein [Bacteriovorax sp. DB6_IX]|uniref:hypothetical protein n=1 Tax=Bacteriovorax sp. DB6_IX TaxID=1353530 RepID=UPI00054FFD03|nr:hypothetical protein [Bacteriovorax sp. DB6_IX]
MKTILLLLIINFAVMGLDISPMSGKYGYSFSENRPVEMLSTNDILNLKEELKIKISKDNKSSKILNQLYNCISSIDVIHHGVLNHEHIIVFSGLDFGKEPSILFFNVVDGVYKSISNEELKKVLSGNPSKYGLVGFDNYFFKISSADKERFKVALVKNQGA